MSMPVAILYLEDNARDAELVRDALDQSALKFELHVVKDRREFEAALGEAKYDLILSDYSLPQFDGLAALEIARHKQPEVPFILISGTLGEERAVDCVLRGATDYVIKQRMERLAPAVTRALAEAKERRQRQQAEAALRESETRYRSLVETAFDWIWEVDAEGRYTYASPKVRDILGYTDEEVLGRTPFDLMPDDEAQRLRGVFQEMVANQMPFSSLENLNRHKYGGLVVLETSGVPVFGPGGEFIGYRGMDRDITERKRAEAALRKSETEFRAMFEVASIGMAQADMATGQWLQVNRKLCEITGYSETELLKMRITDVTHPDDRARDEAALQRVVRGEITDCRVEKRYVRKDGAVIWVNVNKSVIRDGNKGGLRITAAIEDITERKLAEIERARLFTAMEQTGEIVIITDLHSRILYVNPAFEKITGYTRQEAFNKNPRILKSGRHNAEFYRQNVGHSDQRPSMEGTLD